jgi:hypothetical protein
MYKIFMLLPNLQKITRIKINKAKATFTGRRPRTHKPLPEMRRRI